MERFYTRLPLTPSWQTPWTFVQGVCRMDAPGRVRPYGLDATSLPVRRRLDFLQ